MKKLMFIIYITLFIQAEDNISSIYRVEGYNSVSSNQEIMEENNSSFIENNENQESKSYEFQKDYDKALIQAKKENKYIFLLVTEEFCQWCEKLIDIVFQDKKIINKLEENYVGVIVNKDNSYYPSNIGITGVPSVFILDSQTGKIIKTIVGYHEVNYYMQIFRNIDKNGIYTDK